MDHPRAQTPGDPPSAVDVAGVHVGGQSEIAIVGDGDCLDHDLIHGPVLGRDQCADADGLLVFTVGVIPAKMIFDLSLVVSSL
jgi:hypothetical protein